MVETPGVDAQPEQDSAQLDSAVGHGAPLCHVRGRSTRKRELAEVFKSFAEKNVDYDVIASFPPAYDPAPVVDGDSKLVVKGEWKLLGVNVNVK
jgi:hypothetical protein